MYEKRISKRYLDELSYDIIGCAIEVHKTLGPGLLERVYHFCLMKELGIRGISYVTECVVPVEYKGEHIQTDLRLDLLVEGLMPVELKAVETMLPIYEAQLLTYMRLLGAPKGILINFNCRNIFQGGQKTLVNGLYSALPEE